MKTQAKNPVKSVKKAFTIINTIVEFDGTTVSEISEHLDLPQSSVHNYLSTLQEEGYVVQDDNNHYHASLLFLEIGSLARHRKEIYSVAKPEVTNLAQQTGELCNLLVEEHGLGIYLHRHSGQRAVKVDSYTGQQVHLHNTALGKALLAHMPEQRVHEIIDHHSLPATTEQTISTKENLFEELETIRERGVAFDDEERIEGLRCVAAPIIVRDGSVQGAISVAGPKSRIKEERFREHLPQQVLDVADTIKLNLTYS